MILNSVDDAETAMSNEVISDFINQLLDLVETGKDPEKRKLVLEFFSERKAQQEPVEKKQEHPLSSASVLRDLVLKELNAETPTKAHAIAKKLVLEKASVNSMIYKLKTEGLVTGDGVTGWVLVQK